MPKRTDIRKILIIGSGPIIIGQACEFDYSGTQACKALKEEGYEIVLVNSNPATIMTDPGMADRTYIEPITVEAVTKIIERERPDALLPTLGGQTGLNTAIALAREGILDRFGVEMIGARPEVIEKAEDRNKFREAMQKIGLRVPKSSIAQSKKEAEQIADEIGFPIIIRPSFTLGGTGGGIAYNWEELLDIIQRGLDASMIHTVMLEESVIGWKEFELEVMRDNKDNVVIICSIENMDPMGVHTGDSITVAPAQTLTNCEYQKMRDAAIAIMREVGVETGGSNVQFAINPENGEMVVIEMNPRVSRSSALASKATGFPIAKMAAKLAVGYSLDELPNDITRETRASFEPTIDYVVVKIPRLTFEKFPRTPDLLTTSMKSVGETMAIGRTFKEALQKAIRSLEIGRYGFTDSPLDADHEYLEMLLDKMSYPNSKRLFQIAEALKLGATIDEIYDRTKIDRWFLYHVREIVECETFIRTHAKGITGFLNTSDGMKEVKSMGFSDIRLSELTETDEVTVFEKRRKFGVRPVYKLVDTCAAEFEAYTPYYYSCYDDEDESRPSSRDKVVILGGGPNRIGQGIEFDYCCVHASFALRELGIESIMVNSNPETVSTDYDTSDKLYFEPLTREDVLEIIETEKPFGVIVQFGGQTPLNLAVPLEKSGVRILGTSPDAIDRAEDRKRFQVLIRRLSLKQPENATATSIEEAISAARHIGYPVVVRPSYVLGGRAMEIVYDDNSLRGFMKTAVEISPGHPVLIDRFLEDATEVDVDAISDGKLCVVGGIMEHIEAAGVHSGDSACVLPPITISKELQEELMRQTKLIARELGVIGLMNMQFAIQKGIVYILEVNPRASRTVPFVSKATGIPLAKLATKVMMGKSLEELGFTHEVILSHVSVKESVFPFNRFPGVDILLGPEMKSTGEVMGIDTDFGIAFAKAQAASGYRLPTSGTVFVSVHDRDKPKVVNVAKRFEDMGFRIIATSGTCQYLRDHGIRAERVLKISEGRPHVVDFIKNGDVQLVINTSLGRKTQSDAFNIRRATLLYNITYTTTIAGAAALAEAVTALRRGDWTVRSLQEYHGIVDVQVAAMGV